MAREVGGGSAAFERSRIPRRDHPQIRRAVVAHLEKVGVLGSRFEHFEGSHDAESGGTFQPPMRRPWSGRESTGSGPTAPFAPRSGRNCRRAGSSWFETRPAARVPQRTIEPDRPGVPEPGGAVRREIAVHINFIDERVAPCFEAVRLEYTGVAEPAAWRTTRVCETATGQSGIMSSSR